MGAVNIALLNLQSCIVAPGGVTVATAAYTATVAAATAAQNAVAASIASSEASIAPTQPASWTLVGKSATLAGTITTGTVFTVTVNSEQFSYIATGSDTLASVINQLAVAIVIGLGVQAFADGPVLSVPTAVSFWVGVEPLVQLSAPFFVILMIRGLAISTGNLAGASFIQGYTNRIAVNLANAST
jgi:hypothetical protein